MDNFSLSASIASPENPGTMGEALQKLLNGKNPPTRACEFLGKRSNFRHFSIFSPPKKKDNTQTHHHWHSVVEWLSQFSETYCYFQKRDIIFWLALKEIIWLLES